MASDEVLEPDQARELIASNEATVLDLRAEEDWRDKRVPGAHWASEQDLESAIEAIADDQLLVVMCTDDERSSDLAAQLRDQGRQAACIKGGMDAWEKEKFPLQPSTDPDEDATV